MEVKKITITDVISLINSEKAKGKKLLKMKVFQATAKDNKLTDIFMVSGLNENGDISKQLQNMGYILNWKRTDKSVTSKIKDNKSIYTVKPIKTTNVIIHW